MQKTKTHKKDAEMFFVGHVTFFWRELKNQNFRFSCKNEMKKKQTKGRSWHKLNHEFETPAPFPAPFALAFALSSVVEEGAAAATAARLPLPPFDGAERLADSICILDDGRAGGGERT